MDRLHVPDSNQLEDRTFCVQEEFSNWATRQFGRK